MLFHNILESCRLILISTLRDIRINDNDYILDKVSVRYVHVIHNI